MREKQLKTGNMLMVVESEKTLVLTKETKSYFYYFYDNHLARVRKEKLVNLISTGRLITVSKTT